MAKIPFKYYLHDGESSDMLDFIYPQISSQVNLSKEDLGELIGRPFYEIELDCELDSNTGEVAITKATRVV